MEPTDDSNNSSRESKWWSAFATALILTVVICAGAAWWAHNQYFVNQGPLASDKTLIFPSGTGFKKITNILHKKGVIAYPYAFQLMVMYRGQQSKFKAGEYQFRAGISPQEVSHMMVDGKTIVHKVTIPEGLTVVEIMKALYAEERLIGDISEVPEEGTLLPETYHFNRGENRAAIVKRMQGAMRNVIDELWEDRIEGLPFSTKKEMLTLASIVEKETGLPEEHKLVASVYINRLRRGMRLQADPTVVHGMTEGGKKPLRAIRKSDLERKTPYNTYVILGLPPGPIANPGRAAIEAALNPAESDYLYFVATGNGGHYFAKTHKEHIRNVAKYRREIKKRKK